MYDMGTVFLYMYRAQKRSKTVLVYDVETDWFYRAK